MDLPFGENAVRRVMCWRRKVPLGQRVLDGLAGFRAKGWVKMQSKVLDMVLFETRISNVAMIP